MSIGLIISLLVAYFGVLVTISYLTTRKTSANTFYTGDRSSPWYLVAFGMIGASLSGVTFLSVPGWVGSSQFSYMQVVFGYLLGYIFIAYVLMPIYYKLNLVSIYQYLRDRFGKNSYKSGAWLFLLSRTVGASFRLLLVAATLKYAIFERNEIYVPFWVIVFFTIALIWVYTYRGGIKTVVWTDTLQTFFMLAALVICFIMLSKKLGLGIGESIEAIAESDRSTIFNFSDFGAKNHFIKQFLSGAFIAIVMTGLDQDMMQKNLTCRTLRDAQKNMIVFSIVLVVVNLAFLGLGALMTGVANAAPGVSPSGDALFPYIALEVLGTGGGIVFLLGVIAAAYSSADSALTSLTTSYSVDILGTTDDRPLATRKRNLIHLAFSVIIFLIIVGFDIFGDVQNRSIINVIFKAAGYTYGPLLGLYALGIFTKVSVNDRWVPLICVLSPIVSYLITYLTNDWFGFSILIVNGALTFFGLLAISGKKYSPETKNS